MLTAQQLLAMTPAKVRYRASFPRIRVIKDKKEKKLGHESRGLYTRTSLGNVDSTGNSYTLIIRNHGTAKKSDLFEFGPLSQIWCHCSCPYFKYYLEVALTAKGSSSIYDSNGNMPRIRNPRMRPYLCKHLYVTLLHLLARDKAEFKKRYEFLVTE